ncbi:MAG: hypothetical protein K8U03_08120 [Planctomycetia bacterium]|nr:hypothetical protein [Planctomycetia bacterium]
MSEFRRLQSTKRGAEDPPVRIAIPLIELGQRLDNRRQETRSVMRKAPGDHSRTPPSDYEKIHVWVYDVVGRDYTIAVPEDYAVSLDEVWALRLQTETAPTPADRRVAEERLARHPHGDRALPEDILAHIEETPRPDLFRPEAILLDFAESYVAMLGAANDAFRFSRCPVGSLREAVLWAWAAVSPFREDEVDSFLRAASLESGDWEDFAGVCADRALPDWFVDKLCAPSLDAAREHARQHPLRTMVLAEALGRLLTEKPPQDPNPVHSAWIERVAEVKQAARPAAEALLKTVLDRPSLLFGNGQSFAVCLMMRLGLTAEPREPVTKLCLSNSGLTDHQLEVLSRFPALRTLDLNGNPITDVGLEAIARLSELRELNLSRTKVTGRGLQLLPRLQHLEELRISDVRVGDGAAAIGSLKGLRKLNLNNCDLTDEQLAHLANLSELTWFVLNGNPRLTDASVSVLCDLQSLKELSVHDTFSFVKEMALRLFLPNCMVNGEL